MQERSAINVAHGLKEEEKEEEVEKKEESVRDVEDVQDGDGKMHINIGLVNGLNILFVWSKLITCRSFFKCTYMLLCRTFGSVRRKSCVESARRTW
jgi:hypothetical protein